MYRKVIRVRDCIIGISAFERLVYTEVLYLGVDSSRRHDATRTIISKVNTHYSCSTIIS